RGAVVAPSGGLFDQLALDVRVRMPDNVVLRGTDLRRGGQGLALGDLNITVGGDVRVTKTPGDQVRLVGAVTTVRGFYEFQGRRFELERGGTIRFVGLGELNPTLDITASREIAGVIARVHVRGTLREPELDLSSSPPLPDADVLSLIVFNRSINSLEPGERISLAQRAGAIASGFVAAPLAESIGRALDVDLFEIEPTTVDGGFGAGITLGEQIGERLFVRLRQEVGPQDTTEFMIEYRLADFLRLRASAAPGGGYRAQRVLLRRVETAAIDLIFFFSY
ncbi:MAG TPA: translocation/assembly module TamB domain-containing protein, partial [Vicinamibacterales bacterium]|nr:translocation/assembly module TamB domain-containing protein [Vicinamibacterales bacterium]